MSMMDITSIFIAYNVSFFVQSGNFHLLAGHMPPYLYASFFIFPFIFYIFDLYYPFKYFGKIQTLVEVTLAVSVGGITLAAIAYLDRSFTLPRSIFSVMGATLIPLVYLVRIAHDMLFKSHLLDKKTLIIGTGPLAKDMAEVIKKTPHSGLDLVGLIDEKGKKSAKEAAGTPVVGTTANLLSIMDWYNVQLVVMALDSESATSETTLMSQLLSRQVGVTSGIHLYERLSGELPYEKLGSDYLLGLTSQVRMNPYLRVKRLMDVFGALFLLLVMFPILLVGMTAIFLSRSGSVFFIQKRVGKDGKSFQLIKLRSMTKPKKGRPVVTPLGKWIRKYRIDEIPQLINVLRGEMSLIGPRPEIQYFVTQCRKKIPFYSAVFAVKPGLTGWAQIKFRYTTSIKDYRHKFRYNLYYLKNISLKLDLIILLQTIRVVIQGKGK